MACQDSTRRGPAPQFVGLPDITAPRGGALRAGLIPCLSAGGPCLSPLRAPRGLTKSPASPCSGISGIPPDPPPRRAIELSAMDRRLLRSLPCPRPGKGRPRCGRMCKEFATPDRLQAPWHLSGGASRRAETRAMQSVDPVEGPIPASRLAADFTATSGRRNSCHGRSGDRKARFGVTAHAATLSLWGGPSGRPIAPLTDAACSGPRTSHEAISHAPWYRVPGRSRRSVLPERPGGVGPLLGPRGSPTLGAGGPRLPCIGAVIAAQAGRQVALSNRVGVNCRPVFVEIPVPCREASLDQRVCRFERP